MDKYIYILCECFEPNSAAVNRFLAFARGYGEQGVKVKAVFIQPNKKFDMVDESYQNVEFIYLWEKLRINNRYLKFLITRFYLLLFILKLKKGDIVVLYGLIHYLRLFIFKKNIKVYHERTESPDVVGRSHSFIGDIKHNLYLKACKKLDGLFVISPSLNKYFVEEVGVNYKKVHTINMIVDLSRFKDLNFTTKSNTISYCGTISEQKDGISYLLKAFSIVSKKHEDITLNLIGPFENDITKNNVMELIKDLHIEKKVVFLGQVSAENMPRILSDAKILALSRPDNKQAQYGFPTKLGEYLMTTRPVVITRVGDFDKYLNDKENVIFAKSDNANDFAKKLLWTLDNYELAKEIGLKGSEAATNYFNYKIESQKVLKIIFETNIQIKAGS